MIIVNKNNVASGMIEITLCLCIIALSNLNRSVITKNHNALFRKEKLMRKSLPMYSISLACVALLAAGCAGEKNAVKNESAPIAANQSPVSQETVAKTAEPAEQPKPAPASSTSPNDAVAKVGTTIITRKELDRAFTVLSAQNRIQSGSTPEAVKEAQKAALDQLIFAELIYQQGLISPPADLDKQVQNGAK
jgi:hypothetical protein